MLQINHGTCVVPSACVLLNGDAVDYMDHICMQIVCPGAVSVSNFGSNG